MKLQYRIHMAGATRRTCLIRLLMIFSPVVLSACGGGEIDAQDVIEGAVTRAQATTYREDGKPVTGTVVKKNADGMVLESMDYVDGFPNGKKKQWYPDGQLKLSSDVIYKDWGRSTGLMTNGLTQSFCENGTMNHEATYTEDGAATGQHRTWTCKGELLTVSSYPAGEYLQSSEMEDGTIWKHDEGTRTAEGKWDGKHSRYHQNGKPMLVEHWKNGVLDGQYQEWDANGVLTQNGTYAAGQRIGTWVMANNGFETIYDYDINNFANLDYVGPFMQAAGIQTNNSGSAARLPLKDFRVDEEKIRYYVSEGLIDVRKKLHTSYVQDPFVSTSWTYPYVLASRGALPVLEELGADPKAVDSDGRSRLHHCIFSLEEGGVCNAAEIKRLIGLGLAVDKPDINNVTPLLDLVETSWNWRWAPTPAVQLEVARLLLDAGADPDRAGGRDILSPQRADMTPLMVAVNAKRFELATLLLERSKNPAATHRLGYNLVHFAFLDRNLQQFDLRMKDDARAFIELAVSKGVDPAAKLEGLGTLKEVSQRAGAIDLSRYLDSLKAAR